MGCALIACALLLYLLTLDNGLQPYELVGGDLITHQYAQVQARPSNAPGYPLYTMGGWLWFHSLRTLAQTLGDALPNPVPLLSSYSTFWALLALWVFYRILCHLTRSPSSLPAIGHWPGCSVLSTPSPTSFGIMPRRRNSTVARWPRPWASFTSTCCGRIKRRRQLHRAPHAC